MMHILHTVLLSFAGAAFSVDTAPRPLIPDMAGSLTQRDAARQELLLPWGSGAGQAAHAFPQEGAPDGPKALAVDAQGRIHLLDQLNGRVQVFDGGKLTRTLPVEADTIEDMLVLPTGDLVFLDRYGLRQLIFADATGHVFSRIALEGPFIPEAGLITALLQENDDVMVEVEHAAVVRLATVDGSEDLARQVRQGRAAKDGRRWVAGLEGPFVVGLGALRDGVQETTAQVAFPVMVDHLNALDVDARGHVLVHASLMVSREEEPFDVVAQEDQLVVLSAAGAELRRIILPSQSTPEDVYRPVVLGADGRVYAMVCTPAGLLVLGVTP